MINSCLSILEHGVMFTFVLAIIFYSNKKNKTFMLIVSVAFRLKKRQSVCVGDRKGYWNFCFRDVSHRFYHKSSSNMCNCGSLVCFLITQMCFNYYNTLIFHVKSIQVVIIQDITLSPQHGFNLQINKRTA